MKKIPAILFLVMLALAIVSCGKREKVDTSQAPPDVRDAVENAYQLSKDLTDMQLKAAQDKVLDADEIQWIGEAFRHLAIVNNINARDYSTDKYFIALRKDYKEKYDVLADTVVILKDCKGYDDLGLAIQKISLEVRDVVDLPPVTEPEPADTVLAEPGQE